jgi:hypothetical protein
MHGMSLGGPLDGLTVSVEIVSFVDETNEVTRCYDEVGSPGDGQQRVVPSPAPSNGNRSVSIHNLITSPVSVGVGYVESRTESAFSAETLPKMDDYGHDAGAGGGGGSAHAESRGIPLEHILVRPGRTAPRGGGMGEMVRSSLDDSTPQYSDERGGNVPGLHLERSIWPLKDPRDAKLMQHYISHMGKWVCTPAVSATPALELLADENRSSTCTTA